MSSTSGSAPGPQVILEVVEFRSFLRPGRAGVQVAGIAILGAGTAYALRGEPVVATLALLAALSAAVVVAWALGRLVWRVASSSDQLEFTFLSGKRVVQARSCTQLRRRGHVSGGMPYLLIEDRCSERRLGYLHPSATRQQEEQLTLHLMEDPWRPTETDRGVPTSLLRAWLTADSGSDHWYRGVAESPSTEQVSSWAWSSPGCLQRRSCGRS